MSEPGPSKRRGDGEDETPDEKKPRIEPDEFEGVPTEDKEGNPIPLEDRVLLREARNLLIAENYAVREDTLALALMRARQKKNQHDVLPEEIRDIFITYLGPPPIVIRLAGNIASDAIESAVETVVKEAEEASLDEDMG